MLTTRYRLAAAAFALAAVTTATAQTAAEAEAIAKLQAGKRVTLQPLKGKIYTQAFPKFDATDEDLRLVGQLTTLTALSFPGSKSVTDDGCLAALVGSKGSLTDLSIYGTQSDRVMPAVGSLPNLRKIAIHSPYVTTAGLAVLASAPNLSYVELRGKLATDASVKHLAGVTNLREVQLWNTKLGGNGFLALAELKELRQVSIHDSELTAGALKAVAKCQSLEALWLGSGKLPRQELAQLSGLPNLKALLLTADWVQDLDIQFVSKLPALNSLTLAGKVSDKGMKELVACRNLKAVTLYGTAVTDAGLKTLATSKTLVEFLALENSKITPAGAEYFEKSKPGRLITVRR